MSIKDYRYPIEECDLPEARRRVLREYRYFRQQCLECIRGAAETSVANQIHNLAWHTAVFRTLNEARRVEAHRAVNGAFWELTTAGYASLMTLGIRKLVDRDTRTNSLWTVIVQVERRPELLTRELFVCHDGEPYDYEAVHRRFIASLGTPENRSATWRPTRGPEAWLTSKMLHEAFDRLSGNTGKRKRSDKIPTSVLNSLKGQLSHPAIEKVRTMVNRRMAHAELLSESAGAVPIASYNEIDEALEQLVRIANILSSYFFYDVAFGNVVPTPQFDVLDALDQPWVTTENIPLLHRYWDSISTSMDGWANDAVEEFLPLSPQEESRR